MVDSVPTSMPGSLFARRMALLIKPIPLFIVFSIVEKTLFMPDFTESPMALPREEPMDPNLDLIFVHKSPKKEPHPEKTPLMEDQADWNFSRNHPVTFPKVAVMDDQIPLKYDFTPSQADLIAFQASIAADLTTFHASSQNLRNPSTLFQRYTKATTSPAKAATIKAMGLASMAAFMPRMAVLTTFTAFAAAVMIAPQFRIRRKVPMAVPAPRMAATH